MKLWWVPCLGLACGSPNVVQHASPHTQPTPNDVDGGRVEHGDVAALDQREIEPLPRRSVHVGKLTASVEAAADPHAEVSEGTTHITVPLGGDRDSVECYVYADAIAPAARLMAVVKAMAAQRTLTLAGVRLEDVGVTHERAVMFADAMYTMKRGEGSFAGLMKLAVYSHPTTPLLCYHDQVGYHGTFKRLVMGLAESLTLEGQSIASGRFAALLAYKLDGRPMGFTRTQVMDADGGAKNSLTESSTLVQRSPTEFIASDSVRLDAWDAAGDISSATFARLEGGETATEIVLKRTRGNEYAYEGTHAGKKIAGTFKTKGLQGFESDMLMDPKLAKLASAGGELHLEAYLPEIDPTAPVEASYRSVSTTDRTITLVLGHLQMLGKLDEHGHLEAAEINMGSAAKLTLERLLIRGGY